MKHLFLFLFLLLAPLAIIQTSAKEEQCCNNTHHDRYMGILYSDVAGSCIPGGGGPGGGDPGGGDPGGGDPGGGGPGGGGPGGGTGGGGPTEPPTIPPMPPKLFDSSPKLGVVAFNRAKNGRKIKFHVRIKGLEGITGVDIHCRDIAGNDAGVGVTLKKTGWFDHGWEDGTGYIKNPDDDNACNWESLDDIHKSIENGEAFVRVKTEANPYGELSGDLLCIGFYNTDWF